MALYKDLYCLPFFSLQTKHFYLHNAENKAMVLVVCIWMFLFERYENHWHTVELEFAKMGSIQQIALERCNAFDLTFHFQSDEWMLNNNSCNSIFFFKLQLLYPSWSLHVFRITQYSEIIWQQCSMFKARFFFCLHCCIIFLQFQSD